MLASWIACVTCDGCMLGLSELLPTVVFRWEGDLHRLVAWALPLLVCKKARCTDVHLNIWLPHSNTGAPWMMK